MADRMGGTPPLQPREPGQGEEPPGFWASLVQRVQKAASYVFSEVFLTLMDCQSYSLP